MPSPSWATGLLASRAKSPNCTKNSGAGKLTDIFQTLNEHPAKGEITLVIGPPEKGAPGANIDTAQSLAARVDELMHQAKLDRKEALKLAAKERGMTKRDAYRQLLDENPAADEE